MTEQTKPVINYTDQDGNITIKPISIETIAALTASQVEGVSYLIDNLFNEVSEFFTRGGRQTNDSMGVQLSGSDDNLTLDIHIAMKYGYSVPQVALLIQRRVKEQVLFSCNVAIKRVNVHVKRIVSDPMMDQPYFELEEETI
ncbi:Asp23/Gls24 family envelope stress response protein [Atopobacter phocae]|uniref:Asp23/Gls24 family envelope stress response protein n=1 Tax=Atopobacter phocae TaxID=136492 RepID=UPI0004708908|nr:Asp23/Gls24 family envelope stress response protein [Atopobacter phocae]